MKSLLRAGSGGEGGNINRSREGKVKHWKDRGKRLITIIVFVYITEEEEGGERFHRSCILAIQDEMSTMERKAKFHHSKYPVS